jgi:hypothetical protein
MASEKTHNEVVESLASDKHIEIAVHEILGQDNVERLIHTLNIGLLDSTPSDLLLGDTMIKQHKENFDKIGDLTQSYIRQLMDKIPS